MVARKHRRDGLSLAALSLAALMLAHCARAAAPPGSFPTRDELHKLSAAPPPPKVFHEAAPVVGSWQLIEPLPDTLTQAESSADGPWASLLKTAIAEHKADVLLSRSMECAARQTAAFGAEKDAVPAQSLVRFIAGRCGATKSAFAFGYRGGGIDKDLSDELLFEQWSEAVKQDIAPMLAGGPKSMGIAFVRRGDRAAVVITTAQRTVRLEDAPLAPKNGKVTLKGELLHPAAQLRALVTRGPFGYEACIPDIEVVLPRFSVECQVSPGDPTARIELAAFQQGRDLGDNVMDVQVYPAGSPGAAFSRTRKDDETDKAPALATTLVEQINRVRAQAGMQPVRISDPQSRTAAKLAPYYFAAQTGNVDPTVADTVALGMLAGWEVGADIREGFFASHWLGGHSPSSLIEETIARPFGREALLNPSASLIAVGTALDESTLGAIFSTYSMIESSGPSDTAEAVYRRLTKLRSQSKRSPPAPVPELDATLSDIAARLESGTPVPDALKQAIAKSREAVPTGRLSAWIAISSSIEKLTFPQDLLTKSAVSVAIAVARHRPEGSPWTRLAVVFVRIENSPNNTATAETKQTVF